MPQLNPNLIDWKNIPDKVIRYKGKKSADVENRLCLYLKSLYEDGAGRDSTAAHVGISYITVTNQRKDNKLFQEYENAAQAASLHPIDNNMYLTAKNPNAKDKVSAAVAHRKFVHGWKDPRHAAELKEQVLFQITDAWTQSELACARKFMRIVDKHEALQAGE